MPSLLVASTHSGAGKTTATGVLLRALAARGLGAQPFKLGPDFLDAAQLAAVCDRRPVNLDPWMMGEAGVRESFTRFVADCDVAVIEAAGGLYDGADGGAAGSAAEVAKFLGVPVLIVIDAWGMTRTAAAVLAGLVDFDPELDVAGCLLNRVGGPAHARMITAAMPAPLRQLVVGTIADDARLGPPPRGLGLGTGDETAADAERRTEAQLGAAAGIDLERLLAALERRSGPVAAPPRPAATPPKSVRPGRRLRLALARDAAFRFYYEDNLRLLGEAGFDLVPFQPTVDGGLPDDIDAVYLGGGRPEEFSERLQSNTSLAAELRERAATGLPVYAEAGGLFYLGRSLTGFDGVKRMMSGVLPVDHELDRRHLALAYVSVRTRAASPLGPAGTTLRGQEFHRAKVVEADLDPGAFDVTTSDGRRYRGGYAVDSVLASSVHLHFASNPGALDGLRDTATAARAGERKPQPTGGPR
jgi:cobyrinic acid a,c-diamide synthase